LKKGGRKREKEGVNNEEVEEEDRMRERKGG
jgi:hypothetical protein